MIILRKLKIFARRTPISDSLKKEFSIPTEEIANGNFKYEFGRFSDFNEQYKNLTPGNKEIVDRFIKDLKNGFIFTDAREGDGTHYLADESKPGRGHITYSKKINKEDRFNYVIYKPTIDDDGKYNQIIKLSACSEHTIAGKPGAYVGGQRGNVWHPKKHSKRSRGKNK